MTVWTKPADKLPEKSGYYYTYYHNFEHGTDLYKAIFWSTERRKWVSWRRYEMDLTMIHGYVESTYNDYYCPCLSYAEEHVTRDFK